MVTQNYNINMIPGYGTILPVVHVSQYDVGRTITFGLINGDSSFTPPSGSNALIEGTKSDGHGFQYNATISGSTVSFNTTLQMTAAKGATRCELRLKNGSTNVGTANFILQVEQAGLEDDTDTSDSDLPMIIALATEQMQAATRSATAAASSASSASTSASSASASASSAQTAKTAAETARTGAETARNATQTAKTAAEAARDRAELASLHPPYIGANGNWWVYNTTSGQYVDSGVDASITVRIADITMLNPDATPYVTNTGTNTDPIFHLFIPRGKGISNVSKTSTSGLVDTYTITYTDGATYTYTITNGAKGDKGDKGDTGATGPKGDTGTPGKSAYSYATDGGYNDTESKFYEDLGGLQNIVNDAQTAATTATNAAENADASATEVRSMIGMVDFNVDFSTGNLIYTYDTTYNFTINRNTGNLEWEVVA